MSDVIVVAQLRCDVAQKAEHVRHDLIKNRFLLWADHRLERWLTHEGAMSDVGGRVREICCELHNFSGAKLIPQIRPLAGLPVSVQKQMAARMDDAFERAFRPRDVASAIGVELKALAVAVEALAAGGKSGTPGRPSIEAIRRRARSLGARLESLPKGYWVPQGAEGTGTVGR